jgi:hypothetical protein
MTCKVRHNLYLDQALADALHRLALGPSQNKSAIVNAALKEWLIRQGVDERDDRLKVRLDRMSQDIIGVQQDTHLLLESLALFVRYQLLVTVPIPETDARAQDAGRERFLAFIAQVGRQIAAGHRTFDPPQNEPGR